MHNIVSKNTYKVVQFDSSVDWEEEHLRTERGFQLRRERKERKQMEDRNRQNKIDATVDIIHQQQRSTSLVALARRARTVHSLLGIILDLFGVHENNDIATRLATFRKMPLNNIHDSLNEETEGIIIALFGVTAFFNTFRAYLPSAVVTSWEDDDDSPRSRRRRRRQRSWRQTEENVNKRQCREND